MGGSISLAILNNQYKFPTENDPYSDDLRRLIRSMLVTDPNERADIQTVRIIILFPHPNDLSFFGTMRVLFSLLFAFQIIDTLDRILDTTNTTATTH